jgi:hypothetical protein
VLRPSTKLLLAMVYVNLMWDYILGRLDLVSDSAAAWGLGAMEQRGLHCVQFS